MNIDYRFIGSRIKQARKEKGLTQEKLSDMLDVSVGYVSQVERGTTKISLDLLGALSGLLDKDISFFVSESSRASESYRKSELLSQYEKLSPRDKLLINGIIYNMLLSEK